MRKVAAIIGTVTLMAFLLLGVLVWLSGSEQKNSCAENNPAGGTTLCASANNPFSGLGDTVVNAAPIKTSIGAIIFFGAPLILVTVFMLPYGLNKPEDK